MRIGRAGYVCAYEDKAASDAKSIAGIAHWRPTTRMMLASSFMACGSGDVFVRWLA
jgi:hypothetical protein